MSQEPSEVEIMDRKKAAAKHLADNGPGDAVRTAEIAALLRERHAYLAYGKTERAAQVDEQLAIRGHRDPQSEPPKARSAKPRETVAKPEA